MFPNSRWLVVKRFNDETRAFACGILILIQIIILGFCQGVGGSYFSNNIDIVSSDWNWIEGSHRGAANSKNRRVPGTRGISKVNSGHGTGRIAHDHIRRKEFGKATMHGFAAVQVIIPTVCHENGVHAGKPVRSDESS